MIVTWFFGDGGFAIVGPYAAEVWPADLRTSGMGSAYGFGGIGKIIGPLGLALIVGSSNVVTPQASVAAIVPAFIYLGAWFALAGAVYYFLGIETKGRSIEDIDDALIKPAPPSRARQRPRRRPVERRHGNARLARPDSARRRASESGAMLEFQVARDQEAPASVGGGFTDVRKCPAHW